MRRVWGFPGSGAELSAVRGRATPGIIDAGAISGVGVNRMQGINSGGAGDVSGEAEILSLECMNERVKISQAI